MKNAEVLDEEAAGGGSRSAIFFLGTGIILESKTPRRVGPSGMFATGREGAVGTKLGQVGKAFT